VCWSTASAVSPNVQPSAYLPGSSRWTRAGAREGSVLLPQPKSAAKGIVIVSSASVRRQRLQLTDVASTDHDGIGLERGKEACHNVGNVAPPFLLAAAV